jgi:hypothetical protein
LGSRMRFLLIRKLYAGEINVKQDHIMV